MNNQVRAYMGTAEDDVKMIYWWDTLKESGELGTLLGKDAQTPYGFLSLIKAVNLMYVVDEFDSVALAFWVDVRLLEAPFFSLWVRKDMRGKEGREMVKMVFKIIMDAFPFVYGITKQERLLKVHQKVGYRIIGKMPGLWEGEDAWLVYLCREGFATGCFAQ